MIVKKKPLVGVDSETFISVTPEINTLNVLSQILSEDEKKFCIWRD